MHLKSSYCKRAMNSTQKCVSLLSLSPATHSLTHFGHIFPAVLQSLTLVHQDDSVISGNSQKSHVAQSGCKEGAEKPQPHFRKQKMPSWQKIHFRTTSPTCNTGFAVSWVVAPCSVVAGYRRFGGPCCLHIHRGENRKSRLM